MSQSPLLRESDPKIKINILTIRMGGGHYATLNALCTLIEQQKLPWEIKVTDIDEILERASSQNLIIDPVKKLLGIPTYEMWNRMLQKGWTWLQAPLLSILKLIIKLYRQPSIKIFESYWQKEQPDLVLSLVPLYNRSVWETVQKVKPGTPYVTVLIDFADCPPNFWMEPTIKSYVICGTEKAVQQAHALGIPPKWIVQSSGMVIHPRFYQPITAERSSSRESLGLAADKITGLVLFGAQGSMVMLDICQHLEPFRDQLQLIFLCGHNEKLARALHRSKSKLPRFITTFTQDIPDYMHLADFFIGKPGPGCISEALVMNLPVIIERNFATLVPEKYNTQWVQEKQVGVVIPNFRHIGQAVETLLQPGALEKYRGNIAKLNNRAVFEVPEILQAILEQTDQCEARNQVIS